MTIRRAIALLLLVVMAGGLAALFWSRSSKVPRVAPPRSTTRIAVPPQTSVIAIPVSAPLGELAKALEKAVPRQLWTIDKPGQTCVASSRVKILFAKIKTPTIKCRIVGTVVRGPLRLSGKGQAIKIIMPLHAVISARDIGGVLKRETATADALVYATVHLDLASDWSPRGTVSIDYDWTDSPHVDFLGQRIEFTSKADNKLKGVIARLEQTLPSELRKLSVHERIDRAWRSAFTSLNLNQANPPVWMRILPQRLSYGGYEIADDRLLLRLGMTARTETFVGPRPPDPPATPLPALSRLDQRLGLVHFAVPVIADYHEIEPVLMRALVKRSARPFEVPGLGPVNARFGSVEIYGTDGGKVAVGVTFAASLPGGKPSHGTVWLTAIPVSHENSRKVAFTDLSVAGITDSTGSRLLLKLANAPVLADTIAASLTQNFGRDYDDLLGKIGRALADKRIGDFELRAHVDDVQTGILQATGEGAYLPVTGKGTASITLDVTDKPVGKS